jgi:hypothetical protein
VWGKVLAGRGIEVRTSRPRWSLTTLASARPNPAVVKVVFARSGRVARAEIVGPGTGYTDVDGPLLDAIRERWVARGKRFEALRWDDPSAGVTMYFRVTFGH